MKINKWTVGLAAAGVVSLGSVAQAEENLVPVLTSLSSTTISGYVDVSAAWNTGKGNANPVPISYWAGKEDGFNINVVNLTLEKPMDESDWGAGYRVDLTFGPDGNGVNGAVGHNELLRQAHLDLRLPVANGIDLKVGRFDTIIGYESFDGYKNPNFTRSYGYSIEPTQHTGVLASYTISEMLSLTAGVANTLGTGGGPVPGAAGGVGNAFDPTPVNGRSTRSETHKTYMGAITVSLPEGTGFLEGSQIYAGTVNGFAGGAPNQENYYAGFTLATPVAGLSLGGAWDWAKDIGGTTTDIHAFALYASLQASERMTLNLRGEYVDGPGVDIWAATGTIDYALWHNVISRMEVRWDHADTDSFGGSRAGFPASKNNILVAANLIYRF